ncbi:MAG: YmdB family metallophosphoesterase [Oscillospiraceae bacterium]|jgi:metallophosphoesterase (TIGR00282 family)|nr:YmdB family metallophosphoesterase [Oscillospiraceae bacterium]
MRLLMIGDVVSQAGCEFLRACLPETKRRLGADVVIANGENSAVGNGILPRSARHLLDSGVDVITTGNHVFRRKEIYPLLEEKGPVLRPVNYPESVPGHGTFLYDGGSFTLLVVSLLGTSYMEPLGNPFEAMDRILASEEARNARFIAVDFHAEATGEKKAMGYYLDGRVSVAAGTHTHTQTSDEQLLPAGTGYITDLGMTGPIHSVLGIKPECVIRRLRTALPTRFEAVESGPCRMDGCLFELDGETGRCRSLERISILQSPSEGLQAHHHR